MSTGITIEQPTPQIDKKTRYASTAGYYALFIAYGLTMAALGPTLPDLAENTRASVSAISYLFVARSAGSLIGSILSGKLFDRLPGHAILAAYSVLLAAALVITPMVSLLWSLFAITLLLGIAQGGINVGGNALLVWTQRENSGPFMNGLHFFFGVGTFIAPIIVAQALLAAGTVSGAYWILAVCVLLPVPFLLRLPSAKLETGVGSGKETLPGKPLMIFLVSLFLFCYSGASNCFGGWIYTYALHLEIADAVTAAYLTSIFWGALTAGRLLTIPLAIHYKASTLLWIDVIGSLVSLGVIFLFIDNPLAIWIGSAGLGLSLASMFPTTISFAGRNMAVTGQVTAIFSVGASLGSLTLPLVVGQLFEPVGPNVLMTVLLVDLLVAGGALTWMLREAKRS
jgi:FHS family Na+ dependent glucose MFS transporter 1